MELQQIRTIFAEDRYATECAGAVIDEGRPGYARVHAELAPRHKNAAGGVMGGVICTLADFAFAVASNTEQPPTVSVNLNCSFIGAPRGTRLIAEAQALKNGRSAAFYAVDVTDELGNAVARVEITGLRKN